MVTLFRSKCKEKKGERSLKHGMINVETCSLPYKLLHFLALSHHRRVSHHHTYPTASPFFFF